MAVIDRQYLKMIGLPAAELLVAGIGPGLVPTHGNETHLSLQGQASNILDVVARDGETHVQLSIDLGTTVFTMRPERSKAVGKVLEKLLRKVNPKAEVQPEICVNTESGQAVDPTCACDLLETGYTAHVSGATLVVRLNAPSVRRLAVPSFPMVGSSILPSASLEFATGAKWNWFRFHSKFERSIVEEDLKHMEHVGSRDEYVPTQDDVGFQLVVTCTPMAKGECGRMRWASVREPFSEFTTKLVKQPEEACIVSHFPNLGYFSSHHAACSSITGEGMLRFVTYNLLAEYNVKQDIARGDLSTGQLTHGVHEIDFGYRRQRLLQQLAGYHADLICLQEVDRDVMHNEYLHPHLSRQGYSGVYANKANTASPLGCAIYWRQSRLELIEESVVDLTSVALQSGNETFAAFLQSAPELAEVMKRTTTVANLVLLRTSSSSAVCVANVHLFGDPAAPHVRLLQIALILGECRRMIEAHPEVRASLVVCGDFNCGPDSGVCELLGRGCLGGDHPDWAAGRGYQWRTFRTKEDIRLSDCHYPSMRFSHPFKLANGSIQAMPKTYISETGQSWCCDHVFYSAAGLKLVRALQGPSAEFMKYWGAPSSMFPSDHVAVVVDLEQY